MDLAEYLDRPTRHTVTLHGYRHAVVFIEPAVAGSDNVWLTTVKGSGRGESTWMTPDEAEQIGMALIRAASAARDQAER